MNRATYCERILRQIYGDFWTDDAGITINLVNSWLPDAIGAAAKQNYVESIKLDGVAYVNNSFYSTFKDLPVTVDDSEEFCYSVELPQVPYGLGKNEGVSTLRFKKNGKISNPAIPLSINQWAYRSGMRKIPNAILYCPEGDVLKVESVLILTQYTANVTMVSPGLGTDMNSEIHVPEEYFIMITEYVGKMLMTERAQKQDTSNDGVSIV